MVDVPVEVKRALKKGRGQKRYRIEVYTIESDQTLTYEFTISNDNLIKESVRIDERMCSDKYLKFGLCEGTSLEFQYFGMDIITGKKLKVYLDVYYDDGNGGAWYPIIMGYFQVDQCSVQFSTGIRKVIAYNSLMSDYLDQKANALILEEFGFEEEAYVGDVINELLADYAIDKVYEKVEKSGTMYDQSATSLQSDPYKYSNIYGDQGPFSSANAEIQLGEITTNTNVKMSSYAKCAIYGGTSGELGGIDIKITIPDYLDELDRKIGVFYQEQLAKISSSTSAATLWTRIKNLKGPSGTLPGAYLQNYFFSIGVGYYGGTMEYYGRYALNSKGTFSDLSKMTLRGVYKVWICIPQTIVFGADGIGVAGYVDCYGGAKTYYYNVDSSHRARSEYTPPTMDDGSEIVPADLAEAIKVYQVVGGASEADYIKINPMSIADVTLRELQAAVYEMNCQYGQINRETDMFSGVELDSTGLYPSETLYPANNLYPNSDTGGKAIHPYPAEYQNLWTDTVGVQTFRYLRITYKALENGQEVEKVLQRTVYEHGTTDYNMSDNWLFLNLVWTAEAVGDYADAMVIKMRKISWFPFEMWSVGLPYIETGDAIEITDREGNTYTSYVLQRQLSGIQNLQDTYINGELNVF